MSDAAPAVPGPTIVPKPWSTGLGPYYIGLFLGIVSFDQLGVRALPVGGLGWSCLGALVAGPLCYLLLFRVPATWGQATGLALPELGRSTFGSGGARWVPGLLLGLAEVAWFAVAIYYGTDLTFRGLGEVGLLDGRALRTVRLGPLTVQGPLFLATSLVWSVAAALVGRWLVRLIAAIMYVFPVFPAMMLGGAMLAMMGGLRGFAASGQDPMGVAVPDARAGIWSMMTVVQLLFGFFAMAGASGADWGAATSSAKDVRVGGWVAVGLAPVVIATLGLLAVAGHLGRSGAGRPGVDDDVQSIPDPYRGPADSRPRTLVSSSSDIRTIGGSPEGTFRAVMTEGIGGKVGCLMLTVFGVAALAPAVYSSYVFGRRLHATFPRITLTGWTAIALTVGWALAATGSVARLDRVFTAMGALFAPVVGCMTAEHARHKGIWPGPRRGVNLPGLIGWAGGLAVGLIPFYPGRLASLQPAAFWAFLAAFAVYRVVATLGGEAAVIASDTPAEPRTTAA